MRPPLPFRMRLYLIHELALKFQLCTRILGHKGFRSGETSVDTQRWFPYVDLPHEFNVYIAHASTPPSSRPNAAAVRGAHSNSLKKALIGPLAQYSPAGFLFLEHWKGGTVKIAFEKHNGLVPAIVQDDATGEVLMLGFMNAEALAETQRTQQAVFFSRSRNKLWRKGESSGHVLKVRELRVDCDCRLDTGARATRRARRVPRRLSKLFLSQAGK